MSHKGAVYLSPLVDEKNAGKEKQKRTVEEVS